jgi:hypothetical protein
MGLEPGTVGVTSYLANVAVRPGESPPVMDVLRWWFTMDYKPTRTTPARDAFELVGTGVKVLSENELLAERGERVHTGETSHRNQQFAASFTRHFPELAVKYPIYAELRNLFDLALVAGIMREEDLSARCEWQPTFFGPQGAYQLEHVTAPTQVDSVINHRVIDRRHLVVGVSGGVSVDANGILKDYPIHTDTYGQLRAEHDDAVPPTLPNQAWWWD